MTVKLPNRPLPDTYFDPVRRFPLTRIKDCVYPAEAHAMLDSVLQMDLDEGVEEYLNALADHIGIYEHEHESLPDAPASDVLEYLMISHGLIQMRLSEATGIAQSTISAILTGGRKPTLEHITNLASYFRVPSSVFLPNRRPSGQTDNKRASQGVGAGRKGSEADTALIRLPIPSSAPGSRTPFSVSG